MRTAGALFRQYVVQSAQKPHTICAHLFGLGVWQVQAISCSELHELLSSSDSVVLVDVRSPDEQNVSVLPGNVVRKEDFERNLLEYSDSKIVTYWFACNVKSAMPTRLIRNLLQTLLQYNWRQEWQVCPTTDRAGQICQGLQPQGQYCCLGMFLTFMVEFVSASHPAEDIAWCACTDKVLVQIASLTAVTFSPMCDAKVLCCTEAKNCPLIADPVLEATGMQGRAL